MPEIKHNFAGGKMNKDLDERVVPNGEYRDAMNIQVRTTEGDGDSGIGNAGTVQNIPGNELIKSKAHTENSYLSTSAGIVNQTRTIGVDADEKNNKSYWFLAGMDLEQALEIHL